MADEDSSPKRSKMSEDERQEPMPSTSKANQGSDDVSEGAKLQIEDSGYGVDECLVAEGKRTSTQEANDETMNSSSQTAVAEAGAERTAAPDRTRSRVRRRNYRCARLSPSSSSSDSTMSLTDVALRPGANIHALAVDNADEQVQPDLVSEDDDPPQLSDDDSSNDIDDNEEMESLSSLYDSNDSNAEPEDNAASSADANQLREVLDKPKPAYAWSGAYELMNREHGLCGRGRYSTSIRSQQITFQSKLYSSRHIVEKMTLSHTLSKHTGCVNCLNFNRSGDLLVTGSDDLRIIIWNWAAAKPKHCFNSGHIQNIFQTKFVEASGGMNIVSAGRDGQVRFAAIPPSGLGQIITKSLLKHSGPVHKLVSCPNDPFNVYTAGEDGHVFQIDLRDDKPSKKVVTIKHNGRKTRLFSISHHPFRPEFCVCGGDPYVRLYDTRNFSKPVRKLCPEHISDKKTSKSITSAVYNASGSEILASYSEDDIYLFDNKNFNPVEQTAGDFLHRYTGRLNRKTIKGVNFFGPNSEYVVSGSDCGNIFFWDKETESIINFMPGDRAGVVNCLEPHPSFPVLATSGLDSNIKIWTPNNATFPPAMKNLERCIKTNLRRNQSHCDEIFEDRTFFFFVRQLLRENPVNRDRASSNDEDDASANVDDEEQSSDVDDVDIRNIRCNQQ